MMKVAFQKEDIQLLSGILQDQLQQEIPSVPFLQVKCAVKNDRLMILTQHPPEVAVDTEEIFGTLQESLQWQSQYHDEKVELYVRISGEKLPHAKKSITIQAKEAPEKPEVELPEPNNLLDNNLDISQKLEIELPQPNNLLDNNQEISQKPQIELPEPSNLLDNNQEISQKPQIELPQPNNLLDNHQEISEKLELELPKASNLLDNNQEISQKPQIELPQPNNLLDNHQEISEKLELELSESNNLLDNNPDIYQKPELELPQPNNLLDIDSNQEISEKLELELSEANNLLDNNPDIYQKPELELPEPNNLLDNNVGNNQLIFPPLDIPEISSSLSDEDSLDDSFSSLNTEDEIADNPFSSLKIDDEIAENSFSSLKIDDEIAENSFSSLKIDDEIAENSFSSLKIDDEIAENSFSSLKIDDEIAENSFSSLNTDDGIADDSFSSLKIDDESSQPLNATTMLGADTTFADDLHNDLEIEESYDPFSEEENLSTNPKSSLPPLPIILGSLLGLIVIFGGGAFFLIKACVIGECKELKTATQIKTQSQQLLSKAKSEPELISLKQQLDQAIIELNKIPQFSPRSQEAQQLSSSFSEQSTKINQVIQALQSASSAEQQSKKPATSIDELKNRQALWRKAITPLESVQSDPQLGGLAKTKLPQYKNKLETVNKELLSEEAWQKKLATTKTVANATLERQARAKSANDWQRVQFGWQEVINNLKNIPKTSTANQEAEKLLIEYQPRFVLASNRAKREVAGVETYQQAQNLANQARIYEKRNQWQAAIASWQQAIETAKQVSQETFSYSQAQSLIKSYSESLLKAQEQFQVYGKLAQTRVDLNNTCKSRILFCTFNIENQRIIVRLTSDYDQRLANADAAIQTHFRTLQRALGIISDNAKLPIFLYNSRGEERYMKNPQ